MKTETNRSTRDPLVSVVMPVFNADKYLGQAITSILNQTFRDFEFIIINDGSRDNSRPIMEAYARKDERVRIVNQENSGIVLALNRGLRLARGHYIARMDADDISYPHRFEKQVMFLERNASCVLLGTWARIQVEDQLTERTLSHPTEGCLLRWDLLFNSPFVHSSVMLRRNVALALGGYSEDLPRPSPEDYELWWRIAQDHEVANLPEILHVYRESKESICRGQPQALANEVIRISGRNITWAIGRREVDIACLELAAMHHGDYLRVSSRFSCVQAEEILRAAVIRLERQVSDHPLLRERLILELASLGRKKKYLWARKVEATLGLRSFTRALYQRYLGPSSS